MKRRTPKEQLSLKLAPPSWGGAREGAGRKPGRSTVAHRERPLHRPSQPVHVTLRARDGLPSLRERKLFDAIEGAVRSATEDAMLGERFRVVEFSVQSNHLHLIVEAHDTPSLSRGIQGLNVRMARQLNARLRTRGRVFAERFHARALATPAEVRTALVYVLMNATKHGVRGSSHVDPCSSAPWFDGFAFDAAKPAETTPVAAPRTWLAKTGWRRRGLIRADEKPAHES